MARGRKAIPGKIHQLRGTYRPDRHGEEMQIDSVLPDPPDRLNELGQQEWKIIAPELHKLGILTPLDLTILEVYCDYFSKWVKTRMDIDALGSELISETPNGYQQQSALFQVLNVCVKNMQSALAEFGMTPATRARMKLITKKPEQLSLLDMLDELSAAKAALNG